ncbi:MAG: arylsulfatase [Blastopirellula sp.]|nr:MAG: arylsulfatase [Blastopirellula sp.]
MKIRIAFTLLLAFVLSIGHWATSVQAAGKAPRPNIILIMSDDMGISDIGCYGSEVDTPVLDGLAKDGVRFTQFYNTARCCPTRAALMSGLYPHQAGVGHMMNDRGVEGYQGNLSKNCMTIAEVLKGAGYSTYMSGKWHITHHLDAEKNFNWPCQRGFDRFYGTIHGAGSLWDPNTLTRDNEFITPANDKEYQPAGDWFYTDAISDNAVKFINEHEGDNPFFMYVAYTAAHWPMHAHEKDIEKYKGVYDEGFDPIRAARYEKMKKIGLIKEGWGLSEKTGDWDKVSDKPWEARNMEVYAAMIDNMDQGIGKITAELEKQNKLDNTLILFFQDNGGCAEGMGRNKNSGKPRAGMPTLAAMGKDELQTGMIPKKTRDGYPVRQGVGVMAGPADTYIGYGAGWANVSDTPFRLYKHFVHEGGISTPLIAHWPAHIEGGGNWRNTPSHLIDIMATCVDIAGAEYPKSYKGNDIKPMEGKSLVPVFAGKQLKREALYWEHERNCAIRKGKWKLVGRNVLQPQGVPIDKWELYDMEADRSELNNLATAKPQIVKEMHDMYMVYANRANVLPYQSKEPKKKKK